MGSEKRRNLTLGWTIVTRFTFSRLKLICAWVCGVWCELCTSWSRKQFLKWRSCLQKLLCGWGSMNLGSICGGILLLLLRPIQVNSFVGATSQTYDLIIYTKGLNHHDKVEIGNPSQCHLLVFYIDLECGWLEKKNATNATSNYTHHPRCHGRAYNLLVSLNISNDCDLK